MTREPAGRLRRGAGVCHFLRDQHGAVTMEFTVLAPFFIFLLIFFVDASVIYLTHSEMFTAARDISRRIATGELTNQEEVEAYAARRLVLSGREYFVGVDYHNDKTVAITVGVDHAVIFGPFFTPILGEELMAVSVTAEEPRIE